MFVIFRFERSLEGCVGVVVEGNHEVLIAPTQEDMETTCVICVELVDWLHPDVNFIELEVFQRLQIIDRCDGVSGIGLMLDLELGLGGTHTLSRLG